MTDIQSPIIEPDQERPFDLKDLARQITENLDPEKIVMLYSQLKFAADFCKATKAQLDKMVMEYIGEHGAFIVNNVQYRVGTEKKTVQIVGNETAIGLLLEAYAGDLAAIGESLCKEPLKQGFVKSKAEELKNPDIWKKIFKVEETDKVASGKPDPKLIVSNLEFVK